MSINKDRYSGPLLIADVTPEGVLVAEIDKDWIEKLRRQSAGAEKLNAEMGGGVGNVEFFEYGRFTIFDISTGDVPGWDDIVPEDFSRAIVKKPSKELTEFFRDAEAEGRPMSTDLHVSSFLPGNVFQGEFQLRAAFKHSDGELFTGSFKIDDLAAALPSPKRRRAAAPGM